MRNLVLSFVLFTISTISVSGQTLFYQQESIVNSDGVKSKGNGNIICITFIKNKTICYPSDKNGNAQDQNDCYCYKQTLSNGVLLYTSLIKEKVENRNSQPQQYNWMGLYNYNLSDSYENGYYTGKSMVGFPSYKFSSDLSRLNISYTKGSNGQKPTEVYVRVSSPNKPIDETMY